MAAYKVGTVLLDIKADTAKLVSGMDKAEKTVHNATTKMKKYFKVLVGAFAAFETAVGAFKLSKDLIDTAAEFERMGVAMKTLTGNAKLAQENMQWITTFAAKTPYQINQITEAFIKLKSYGIDAKNDLKTLGDTASAMGKPLSQAVEAIADAVNGEFERLKEFGIKSRQVGNKVAFQWTTTSGQIKNIVIQNNSKIIESTLKAIWNSKYAGGMEAQSRTWNGMWSNIKDTFTQFKLTLMNSGIFRYLKSIVKLIQVHLSNAFVNSKGDIKDFGQSFVSGMKIVVETTIKVLSYWNKLKIPILSIKLGWLGVKAAFFGIVLESEKAVNKIIRLYNKLPFVKKISINEKDRYVSNAYLQTLDEIKQTKQEIRDAFYNKGFNADKTIAELNKYYKEFGKITDKAKKKIINLKGIQDGAFKGFQSQTKKAKYLWEKYYRTIGDMQKAWLHSKNRDEALETAKTLKLTKKQREEYLKKVKALYIGTAKKTAKEITTIFDQVAKNMYNSFSTTFFDAITLKFKSFKSFLKSLFNDIASSIINPFAKSISGSLAIATMGALGFRQPISKQSLLQSGFTAIGNNLFKNAQGQVVKLGSTGNIISATNAQGQSIDITSVIGLTSLIKPINSLKNAVFNLQSGISYATGTIASGLINVGLPTAGYFTQGLGAGIAYPFTPMSASGAVGAGVTLGQAGVGFGLGYLGGNLMDKLLGADTHAGLGAGAGAAIGSLIAPGLGTAVGGLIGGVIGGLFGKTKVTGKDTGIDIFGTATANDADGRYWGVTHYKKKSWFHSKHWDDWKYKDFGEDEKNAIETVISTFNLLLKKMGDTDAYLRIKGGRFKNIEDFLDTNVVKAFLDNLMHLKDIERISKLRPTLTILRAFIDGAKNKLKLDKIYNIWKNYAKAINKKVYEALSSEISKYISYTRTFKTWLFGVKGDTLGQLKYLKDIAETDLKAIRETLGKDAKDVTIGNFLDKYKQALQQNPTPETIEKWKQLGEALQAATEAEKKYLQALYNKKLNAKQYAENYKLWLYESKGDVLGKTQYLKDLAEKNVEILKQTIGEKAARVTADNFLQVYQEVLKNNPNEKIISSWQKLGEALKTASEVSKKYAQIQKENAEALQKQMQQKLQEARQQRNSLSNSKAEFNSILAKDNKSILTGQFNVADELLAAFISKFTGQNATAKQVIDSEQFVGTGGTYGPATGYYETTSHIEKNAIYQKIYNAWKGYADKIKTTVQDAMIDSLKSYLNFKDSFSLWLYDAKSDALGKLKHLKEIAENNLKAIKKVIGKDAANITIDNFLNAYKKAVKKNFTPEVLNNWKQLGEALENVTEAEKKYKDYLKQENLKELQDKQNILQSFINLRANITQFLTGWHSSGYGAEETFNFYTQRYKNIKENIQKALKNNNISAISNYLNSLETVASNLKSSAEATGDRSKIKGVLNAVENDFKKLDAGVYKKGIDVTNEILNYIKDKEDLQGEELKQLNATIAKMKESVTKLERTISRNEDSDGGFLVRSAS